MILAVIISLFLSSDRLNSSGGWELLSSVSLTREYDDFMGQEVDVPAFSEEIRRADGGELVLEGYVIPLDQSPGQKYFVLSRFPFQSCFFCGNAGPETVVEVYSNEMLTVFDQRVRVQGRFQLNENDPLHLYYMLKDCEVKILD